MTRAGVGSGYLGIDWKVGQPTHTFVSLYLFDFYSCVFYLYYKHINEINTQTQTYTHSYSPFKIATRCLPLRPAFPLFYFKVYYFRSLEKKGKDKTADRDF